LTGCVWLLCWARMSPDAQQDFALAFLSILFEGAPFILMGTLISGFIDVYLPPGTMDRFLPKNKGLAVIVSGFLGAIFPVCECAVVPVIRRLVKKGLPVSCGITYMLAAPIVNPITALSTWKAFQGQGPWLMTCSRLSLGFLLAVAVGLIVTRMRMRSVLRAKLVDDIEAEGFLETGRRVAKKTGAVEPQALPAGSRLVAAFRSAMRDFVEVGVYFTIGVAITALFNTGIAPGAVWLDGLAQHTLAAPAALMMLGFILSLCSTSDAFIAATLDKFSWGAKLAFLTYGPMMDVKLIFLYLTVMRRWFIVALSVGLFLAAGTLAILTEYWFLP